MATSENPRHHLCTAFFRPLNVGKTLKIDGYSRFSRHCVDEKIRHKSNGGGFRSVPFDSLDEGTSFGKIVQYRAIDLTKIEDKEQRKFYSSMKRIHSLPDMRTDEEKVSDMNDALSAMFDDVG